MAPRRGCTKSVNRARCQWKIRQCCRCFWKRTRLHHVQLFADTSLVASVVVGGGVVIVAAECSFIWSLTIFHPLSRSAKILARVDVSVARVACATSFVLMGFTVALPIAFLESVDMHAIVIIRTCSISTWHCQTCSKLSAIRKSMQPSCSKSGTRNFGAMFTITQSPTYNSQTWFKSSTMCFLSRVNKNSDSRLNGLSDLWNTLFLVVQI